MSPRQRIALLLALALPAGAARADASRPELLRALTGLAADPDTTRAQAALTAGNLHHPIFVQPLIARLGAPEANVRAAAATGLGELGVPSSSRDLFDLIGALMRAAEESDDAVAKAAIEALGRYPFPEVRMRLEKIAGDALIAHHRRAAAFDALKQTNAEAKARMSEWLDLAAREAGGQRAADTAPDVLLRAARDLLSRDRSLHVQATKTIAAWTNVDEKLPFLRRALSERNVDVRRVAAHALADTGTHQGAIHLAAAAADEDADVRRSVIDGLAKQRDPLLATALVVRFKEETDTRLRKLLSAAIAVQEDRATLDALSTFGASLPNGVRSEAIELAAARTATQAAEVLVRFLLDAKVDATAGRALSHLGKRSESQVVPSLLGELERSERDSQQRSRLLEALEKRESPEISARALALIERGRGDRGLVELVRRRAEAREGLLAMTSHGDPKVRTLAFDGIEEMRGPDVLRALIAAVDASPQDDRAFALLLAQKDQELLTPLLDLLGHEKHTHRAAALFTALEGKTDARIAEPVLNATLATPDLAPAAITLLKAQEAHRAAPALAKLAGTRTLKDNIRARATAALAELSLRTKGQGVVGARAAAASIDAIVDRAASETTNTNRTTNLADPAASETTNTNLAVDGGNNSALTSAEITAANLAGAGSNNSNLAVAGNDNSNLAVAGSNNSNLAVAGSNNSNVAGDNVPNPPTLDLEALIKPLAKDDAVEVRSAARNALHRLDPTRYPKWDPYGRVPLVVEAGLFGAGMMLVAADLADAELSPAFTGAVGLVLGGATPFLLTLNEDVTLGDAGYFGTIGLQGTLGGWGLGGALGLSEQNTRWATLGGEILGVSIAGLTMKHAEWSLDEVALTNFSALEAGITAAAFTSLYLDHRNRTSRSTPYVGMTAAAFATIPVAFFARKLEVDDHLLTMGTLMAHGAFLGMFAPGIADADGYSAERAATALVVGQGAGYFAGLVLAQLGDASPRGASFSALGAVTGAALFGGTGLTFDTLRGRPAYALAQGGAAAGALAMFILEDHVELHDNDVEMITYATIGGAIAGGQFSVRLEEKTFNEPAFPGGMLMGAGAGMIGGLVLSQLVDLSDKAMYGTIGGGALFGVAGTGLGYLIPNLGVRPRSTITGGFIAGGLALTAPFANELSLSDPELGYLALVASTAGLTGAFVPSYWTNEQEPLKTSESGGGALLGASLGAAGAIAAAQLLELETRDVGVASLGTLVGGAIGGGLGLLVPALERRSTVALLQGGAFAGLLGSTALVYRTGGFAAGREGHLGVYSTAFALHGALHGGLVPYTWREGDIPEHEVAGGVLFGAGTGALLGALMVELSETAPDSDDVVEATMYSATADSLALGIGLFTGDRRLGAGLAQGLGIGSYAAALAIAPYTTYESADSLTFLLGATTFGAIAGLVPYTLEEDPSASRIAGATIAGASLALLGTSLYVQLADRREDLETATMFAAAATGAGGMSLLFPELDTKTKAIAFQSAGVLALASGIAFAPYTTYSEGDYALIATLGLFGGWHGGWVPALRHETGRLAPKEIGGGVMFGSGAGLIGGMVLSQFIEPDSSDVGEAFMLSAAFAGAGAGLELALPDADRRTGAMTLQIAGGLGLGLSALAAPYTTYSDNDYTLLLLTQAMGAAHGTLLPRIWTEEPTDVMYGGGALFGAGAGAVTGALLAQLGEFPLSEQLESTVFMAAGDLIGGGIALFREDDPGRDGILAFEAAGLGLFGAGLALSQYTEFDSGDQLFIGMGTALGAWHGAFLPLVLGERAGVEGRQELGGAMLGAGAGALLAGGISQLVTLDPADQVEGALGWTLASMIGGGAALTSRSLDRRGKALLVEGAGLAGLTTGLLLSSSLALEGDGDFALLPSALALGGALGATLPVLLDRDELREEEIGGGALLGAGVFAAGALTLAQFTNYESEDVAELSAWTLVGSGLGAGLGFMIPETDRSLRYGMMNGAALLALGSSLVLAPVTELDDGDFTTIALSTSIGAAMGGGAPGLWNSSLGETPPREIGGGVLFGSALGAGSGLLLSQAFELEGKHRKYAALGASMGALSGGGIGLLASKNDRLPIALAEGLTFAGALGVAASAGSVNYDAGDLAFGSAYVAYLTWHSLGLTLLLDGDDRQAAGAAMATVGLGTLTGMYLTPYINLDLAKVLMLFAGNVWGTWIGGWGGAILRDHVDELHGRKSAGLTLISTVLGSDLGLTITGLVVGGLLDVEPTRFAVINLSGLGGMMLGMLAAGFAKSEPLKEGNVIGSLSGLVLGAVVTSFIDFKSSPTWDELLASSPPAAKPKNSENEAPKSPGSAKLVQIESWFPSAQVEPTEDGDERYMFSILGTWQ